MKVDELTGATLDYWVARAEGLDAELIHMNGMDYCRVDIPFHDYIVYVPTHNWQLLGPIVTARHYLLYPRLDDATQEVIWLAEAQLNPDFHGMCIADTAELALCRLRVTEAFGDTVTN